MTRDRRCWRADGRARSGEQAGGEVGFLRAGRDSAAPGRPAPRPRRPRPRSARCWPCRRRAARPVADREARRHGQTCSPRWPSLQRALLADGGDDGWRCSGWRDLRPRCGMARIRRLAAMVSAIVLRVRVELARRQME